MRVALFVTCLGDAIYPEVGRATVEVLERLGHEVVFPEGQTCCGQMHVNSGHRDEARALARRFVRVFEPYEAVVTPSSSCAGCVRDLTPSLRKALCKWYSTVLGLMNSCAAISRFALPCTTRRAI